MWKLKKDKDIGGILWLFIFNFLDLIIMNVDFGFLN